MAIKSFLSEGGFSVGSVGSAPIEVIDSSGNITAVGLTVSGNLVVNGSTTTINSTTTTLDDPIFTLGGDTVPTSDDNKDRGIEFRWHDGSLAKVGFFGFDDSTGKFVFIPNATNTSEVFSGTKGTIDANLEWADVLSKPSPVVTVTLTGDVTGTANTTLTSLGNGTITISTTVAADSVALGTDTTGNYVASITNGSYITGGNGGSEGAALTLAVDATSANTASKVVARDASGNFSAGVITGTRLEATNSGIAQLYINSTTNGSKEIVFQNNGSTTGYVWQSGSYVGLGGGSGSTSLFVTTASGNTGIGTTSPGGRLEVNFTAATAATALILRTSDSGANGAIRWQNSGGTNQAGIGSNFNVSDVGALEFLNGTTTNVIFRSSGNVGIGTTAPDHKLDVVGAASTDTYIRAIGGSGGTKGGFIIGNNDVTKSYGKFYWDNVANTAILHHTYSTGYLGLGANSRTTDLVILASNGMVGIGTASPTEKFHVAGTVRIDGTNDGLRIFRDGGSANITSTLYLANSTNTRAYNWQLNSTGNGLDFWTYDGSAWANKVTYLANGNVGIGTTSPTYKLEISGSAGSGGIARIGSIDYGSTTVLSVAPGVVNFDAAGVVGGRFTINSSGNVGINKTSPSHKLDVDGAIRTTDWLYIENSGYGVYSNASGLYLSTAGNNWDISSGAAQTWAGLRLYKGGKNVTWLGHFYGDSTGQGFLDSGGNWQLIVDSSSRLRVYAGVYNMDQGIRVLNPGGAAYSTASSTVTGAWKIKLPTDRFKSNTMMRMTIKIYRYSTGTSTEFNVGGYNYSDAAANWYNIFAEQQSDIYQAGYNIRFGNDGTANCIWIGETNSTWDYPQVFVTDFQAGYGGTTQTWASGWSITPVTAFDTVTQTRTAAVQVNSNNIGNFGVNYITGTANQVLVNGGSGANVTGGVTLTLPQNIHTSATPTFGGGTLNGTLTVVKSNGGNVNGSANAAIYLSQDESSIQGPGTNTVIRMGGNLVLGANSTWIAATNGTTALTINNSQNSTFAGTIAQSGAGANNFSGYLNLSYSNLDGVALPGNGSTTAANIIGWNRSGGGGEMNFINAKGPGSAGGFRFSVYDGTTLTNRITVDGSGNTTLGGNLTVSGTGNSKIAGSLGLGVDAIANTRLYVRTAATTDKAFYSDNGVDTGFAVQFASSLTSIGNDFNKPLAFLTNNTERMRLFANGNLFVGASPVDGGQKLQVSGTGYISGNTRVGDATGTKLLEIAGSNSVSGAGAALALVAGSTYFGYIGRASYVTSGSRNTNDVGYLADTGLGHYFYTNGGTLALTLESSQNATFAGNITVSGTGKQTLGQSVNATVYAGNTSTTDQAIILSNTRRANYGDVMIAKNLEGVASADSYATPGTTAGTGYAAVEMRYGGVVRVYGNSGATTAAAVVSPNVLAEFTPTGIGLNLNTSVTGNLTVSGNLIINGTTTTVNSTTTTLDDPIITLGGDTAPTVDDNKDRGVEFRWHNGTAAKVGFFGYDDSTGYFTFIPDATNTSEVFSGTKGTIDANLVGNVTGNVSGSAGSVATLTAGTYLTGGSFNGSTNVTFAVDATSANTASKVVARDASGNFSAGTITAALSGNATTATTLQTARNIAGVSFNGSADISITGQNVTTGVATAANDLEVAKYLRWKNYNNNHVLIDASAGTSPSGGAIDRYTAANTITNAGAGSSTWGEAISLMGWNGTATYGVRVDRARTIDNQANSATTTAATANTASTIVLRDGSGNFSAGTITAALSGNATTATTWQTARNFTIGSTARSVNGSADVTWTLADIGAAAASHNHTSLTGVTSIGFAAEASDSASISTTISSTQTFFDFNLTDDNNNDLWRWRFTPSGSTVYNAMTLSPSANGVSDLVVAGTITGTRLISNVATGTAPLTVASTTLVTNLNADLLDGLNSATGNTASTIVARDSSGNFSAGTVTAALSGNATTATTWQTARNISIGGTSKSVNGSVDVTWTTGEIGINNGTLTLAVSGTGLSGSASFTANQSGNSTFTVTSNATSANAVSTIVARDASGNFATGGITTSTQVATTKGTLISEVTPGLYANAVSTGNAIGIISKSGFANQGAWANIALNQTTANANDLTAGVHMTIGGWFENSGSGLPIYLGCGYVSEATPTMVVKPANASGGGNVGIGTTSPGYKLEVNGSFAATTKSFVIKHPTKEGKRLRYGSLEGPENGVYVRGKLKGTNIIELPDYWTKLVDPESITVQLTPIGSHQKLYVEKIVDNKVYIANENLLAKAINCFFYVLAERCDVEKLEVEIDA